MILLIDYTLFYSKSWYKSKNIEKIKIHYYEKLIENVYEEYPNLNLSMYLINI